MAYIIYFEFPFLVIRDSDNWSLIQLLAMSSDYRSNI